MLIEPQSLLKLDFFFLQNYARRTEKNFLVEALSTFLPKFWENFLVENCRTQAGGRDRIHSSWCTSAQIGGALVAVGAGTAHGCSDMKTVLYRVISLSSSV